MLCKLGVQNFQRAAVLAYGMEGRVGLAWNRVKVCQLEGTTSTHFQGSFPRKLIPIKWCTHTHMKAKFCIFSIVTLVLAPWISPQIHNFMCKKQPFISVERNTSLREDITTPSKSIGGNPLTQDSILVQFSEFCEQNLYYYPSFWVRVRSKLDERLSLPLELL